MTAFWDTNLLIYWMENNNQFAEQVSTLTTWLSDKQIKSYTSTLSLAEILVHPMTRGEEKLAQQYKTILSELGCISFGEEEAWTFAKIRSQHKGVKAPDCIQLACAATHKTDYFLTNDKRLSSVRVEGIGQILSLSDLTS